MERLLHVLSIVLPVLLTLALGALARRKKLFTREGAAGLKALVSTFTLPVVLFGAFYNATYDVTILVCATTVFVCCIAGLLLGRLVSMLLKTKQTLLPYLTTGFEMGMMGYALYIMLFGAAHVTSMAIADLGQVLFVFSIYMSLLNARNGMGQKETLHAMVTSPVFLSILAGLLFGITGLGESLAALPVGGILASVINFIGTPTGCVILFVVGYEIELSRNSLKEAAIAAVVRLIIMAVLCASTIFIIGLFVEIDRYLQWALLLMFILPGPFVLPLFVKEPAEAAYASTCLSLYTLLSIGLFAVLASLASVV